MTIVFDLPSSIERQLRSDHDDVNRTIKEAALVELYRQNKLTHNQLSESLGIDRFETEALLKKHNVTEDFPDEEEYLNALRHLGVAPKK